MSESIYLQGSETVHQASVNMTGAADQMQRAANLNYESFTTFIQRFAEQLDQLETILREDRHKRGIL